MTATAYIRISEGEPLPDIGTYRPFRAVVVIDDSYSGAWQDEVSAWLVRSGCLYMMAWGERCSSWDDSVDVANLEEFDFGDIPDAHFVMTTWHDDEPLDEVFWYSGFCGHHPDVELKNSLIVHVGVTNRRFELLSRYEAAQTRYA